MSSRRIGWPVAGQRDSTLADHPSMGGNSNVMPGVRPAELTKVVDTLDSGALPYYRVAEMWWDSMHDLRAALNSGDGKAVLDDLPNSATGGTALLISEPD